MYSRPKVQGTANNEKDLIEALLSNRGATIETTNTYTLDESVVATFTLLSGDQLSVNCDISGISYGDKGRKPVSVKVRASEGQRSALRVRFKELDVILD